LTKKSESNMKKIKSVFWRADGNMSAFSRVASVFLTGAAMIVLLGFTAQKAYAHSLTITATASCGVNGGAATISYTVTSWDQNPADPGGTNPEIQVLFNGVVVDTEPFISTSTPPNQFSNTMPAPAGATTVDVEAFAVQNWGDGYPNGETATVTGLPIPTNCAPGTGRFTGGGKQVAVGVVTVTKGFEVDCDLHQPSNNLQINWQDPAQTAHHFHMTAFTSAACSKPGNPNPPTAPVNQIIGGGTGLYDGMAGYSVAFELIDNGEPGAGVDEAGFVVYNTATSAVVLNVPLAFITGGNIQAHVDQK
jgi:hypothetical protein